MRKDNDPSEWVAIPVPDAGIPREWVERARAAVKDNARQPDADRRFWELKTLLFCPCGHRLTTFVARRKYKTKTYTTFHYVCSHRRRHGAGSCEHARYHKARELEERVREDVERERERLRHADKERAAWAEELAKVERRRDAYVEMRADGDITREEFREKAAGLDKRKAPAERELEALEDGAKRVRFLDSLPGLIEEYIRELPDLVHGREGTVREHVSVPPEPTGDGYLNIYKLTPERVRCRTPKEIEELRDADERERGRRYRALYDMLGVKVMARKDDTLEVSGTFGLREMQRGSEPTSVYRSVAGGGAEDDPTPDDPGADEENRCRDRRSPRP